MRIWKYTLEVTDTQELSVPSGAKFLDVQMQGDMPQLWALVNERDDLITRKIAIYGTGNPLPNYPGQYLATFQIEGLVFHVFEI